MAVAGSLSAQAQTSGGASGASWLPYTQSGYVGLNVGRPRFETPCGVGAFACDDPSTSLHLYTGGNFNDYFGLELGYLNTGEAERGGCDTSAQGLNLSLVGRLPLGPASVFVKGGTTYGRTKVTANPLSGLASGSASGWGGSYGAGVGLDFGTHSTVVLEWAKHDYEFIGTGREGVKSTSLGYRYRF